MAVAPTTGRNVALRIGDDGLLKNGNDGDMVQAWTNACTYVFKSEVFRYLNGNYELDKRLLPILSEKNQVAVYKHDGFWSPVETMRDKVDLENRWNAGIAPWKVWNE